VTIRTRLKRLERLVPPGPAEPLSEFLDRLEVKAALNADSEFLAAQRAAYQILCEALESEGERPPAEFLPGWPSSELTRARRSRDPDERTWAKECRPEAERILSWMQRTPEFDLRVWLVERRPDFLPAWARLAAAMRAVLWTRFGRTPILSSSGVWNAASRRVAKSPGRLRS
jgi:hypothetical protein